MTIWNLGSINIDHIYQLATLPKPGETLSAKTLGYGLGGKGANQSVAAARAGARTVHLGAMGPGDDWVLDRLRDAGIDTSHIRRLPDQPTGHAIILVDAEAENAIIIYAGANRALNFGDATWSAMQPGDLLLLQNETNQQVEAAQAARERGLRTIVSAAPFDSAAVRALLPHTSILALNEGEAAQLAAEIGEDLPIDGLLVTRGAKGAQYRDLTTGAVHDQPAFPVTPVDTTGAGDCFAGYFAAGLDAGLPIPEALRRASAAAAIKVTRPGAGDAVPLASEVDEFLASQP